MRYLTILLAIIASLFVPSTADAASTQRIVYVESHLHRHGSYNSALHSSIEFVDAYTHASIMVLGRCRANRDCIIVHYGNVPGPQTGRTANTAARHCTGFGTGCTTIRHTTITVQGNVRGYYTRRALLDHEFGHAFGLAHNPHPVSRMWEYIRYHGHLLPRHFTTTERRILAGR